MTSATYEIAGTDELEALGRDDAAFDTSAGIGPDEIVHTAQYDDVPESSGKRRWCLCLVIAVLMLAAVAAFLGVFFSVRTKGPPDNAQAAQPDAGGEAAGIPDNPGNAPANLQPVSPPNTKPTPVAVQAPAAPPTTTPPTTAEVKTYAINVVDSHPHDGNAFTQGFEYADGVFYESTGLRGASSLRKVEMATGRVLQKYDLPDMTLFGEGMTLHTTHHIFMLTWQAGRGFIFNQSTFEVVKEWSYKGEGWGLTMDRENDEVYMSDGTTELRVLDPEDLSERRRVRVSLHGRDVMNLNELEWVCGEIWANVWLTSKIYRIDPATGVVKSIINASILPLKNDRKQRQDVLNGIAFDRHTGRLWLTGKKWSTVYQVTVTDDSLDLTTC